MKLENFKKASDLVKQITAAEERLRELSGENVTIVINFSGESGRIMTIGAYPASEHPNRDIAITFISSLRLGLETTIKKLTRELDAL